MAVEKLSQIVLAPAPPALTDTLIGVGGGTTDYQYTMSQLQMTVGGLPRVSQDPRFSAGTLNLFVATTGSDSNDGTVGSPFATVTHAVRVATSFQYENLYTPFITVAAGTYNESDIPLPEIFYAPQQASGFINGAGRGVTIINAQGGTDGFRSTATALSDWVLANHSIDSNTRCISGIGDSTFFATSVGFRDSSNSGNMICIYGENYNTPVTSNVTVEASTIANYLQLQFNAQYFGVNAVNFPAGGCTVTDAVISITQGSNCLWNISSSGTASGPSLRAKQLSAIYTPNGLVSDLPGNGSTFVDGTAVIASKHGVSNFDDIYAHFFATQSAGIPVAANVNPGCWTVVKDTSGGGVYVLYNDAGTIKKVALV